MTVCHGLSHLPEYGVWYMMKQRCLNPTDRSYANYGGRGITVAPEWINNFAVFLADVGRRPDPSYSLDRIDNDGIYEPGNVRWTTRREQMNNKRTNRLITHDGRTQTISQWAQELGLNPETIHSRLWRGHPPLAPNRRPRRLVTYGGRTQAVHQWAKELGIHPNTIHFRLSKGASPAQALGPVRSR
jgi:hypothetical protein